MTIIGIDPSINSTGVCVWDEKVNRYFLITSKMTKKMLLFKHDRINIDNYIKKDTKDVDYSIKESNKFDNIYNICCCIQKVIDIYKPDIVYIEGVSYGSVGSAALVDLSFLNSAIRLTLKLNHIPFTIVSPTSLKKFACANGQAEKLLMVDAWKRLDNIGDLDGVKLDDLADSYFLAHYHV